MVTKIQAIADRTASSEPVANKLRVRPRNTIRLRGWYTGTYAEIACNKRGDMDKLDLKAFSPKFERLKPLARELRKVLFPIKEGTAQRMMGLGLLRYL